MNAFVFQGFLAVNECYSSSFGRYFLAVYPDFLAVICFVRTVCVLCNHVPTSESTCLRLDGGLSLCCCVNPLRL